MSTEEKEQKSISLLTFSGKKKNFNIWWKCFNTYATMKNFAQALSKIFTLPSDPENLTGTDKKREEDKKKVIKNNLAIACMTMAFLSEEDMEYLEDSATTQYENGVAKEVAESLLDAYRPKDRLSAVEAEQEMRKVKLTASMDPDNYFKKVAVVKSKYKKSKTFDGCIQKKQNV